MTETTAPKVTFDQVSQALESANADADASEAHGILCGMICATGRADMNIWLQNILGEQDPRDLLVKESQAVLMDLQTATMQQFSQGDYDLELLLRDDEEPLEERIQDLGEWCQGFLFGMTLSGIKDMEKLPQDSKEIMQDILQISKAGYNEDESLEESESAYTEVVEYVRVGALVIFAELNQPIQEQPITLH